MASGTSQSILLIRCCSVRPSYSLVFMFTYFRRSFELNTYLHEDLPQFDDTFVKNMTTFLFSLNNLQTIRYKTPARTNPQTIAYFEQHSRNTPKRELSNVTSLSVSRNNLWLARYCPNLVKLEVLDDLIPDDYGPLNYEDLKGCKQLKRLKLKEKISQEVMDGTCKMHIFYSESQTEFLARRSCTVRSGCSKSSLQSA